MKNRMILVYFRAIDFFGGDLPASVSTIAVTSSLKMLHSEKGIEER